MGPRSTESRFNSRVPTLRLSEQNQNPPRALASAVSRCRGVAVSIASHRDPGYDLTGHEPSETTDTAGGRNLSIAFRLFYDARASPTNSTCPTVRIAIEHVSRVLTRRLGRYTHPLAREIFSHPTDETRDSRLDSTRAASISISIFNFQFSRENSSFPRSPRARVSSGSAWGGRRPSSVVWAHGATLCARFSPPPRPHPSSKESKSNPAV